MSTTTSTPTTSTPTIPNLFRTHPGILILDGGLASLLESKYNCNLNHTLWSTQILEQSPETIRNAHTDFIQHGQADIIITCTYQTSIGGFNGDVSKFEHSLETACRVGREAIQNAIMTETETEETTTTTTGGQEGGEEQQQPRRRRRRVILAGSLGSYGASLCNGEEYTGDYNLPPNDDTLALALLEEYHLPRMLFLKQRVDIFAAETIPIAAEGRLLSDLFLRMKHPGYVSFSCRSGTELCSGESFAEAVASLTFSEYLVGVGVNCTSVKFVEELVGVVKGVLEGVVEDGIRPCVLVYPNSGECYCGVSKMWKEDPELVGEGGGGGGKKFADFGMDWVRAGAKVIGGCCRVGPEEILELRRRVVG